MTGPGLFEGGRTVASSRWVALVLAGALVGCHRGSSAQSGATGGTATVESALTSPATWSNLWGSWPTQRYAHASAYDTDRAVLVTYGGQYNTNGPFYGDVWEWSGSKGTWTQRTPVKAAGTRSGHGMVYDPVIKKTLMWGGWQPGASFFVGGMWEWDGKTSTWIQRDPSDGVEPPLRHDHIMIYDPDRARTIIFGGQDEAGNRLNDVWEWNSANATWTQRTIPGSKPPGRYAHGGVFDAARKRIVVFGGNTGTTTNGTWVNETWELDETAGAWQQYTTVATAGGGVAAPNYYYTPGYTRLGYDGGTHKVILYQNADYLYEWDPATPTWTKVAVTRGTETPPSYYPTLTYDPVRAVIVLVGGYYNPRHPWEINTTDYSMVNRSSPASGPLQRQYPAVAFDSKNGKLMVFGGRSTTDNLYKQDIWEWSGTNASFIQRTTVDDKPEARYQSAMVYDSKRQRLLLYGGTGNTTFDDLWQWDVSTRVWSKITVSGTRPTATYGHWMFYDEARDKVLLMYSGGFNLWELDPVLNTWKNRTVSPQPAVLNSRSYYELTFDSDRGKLIVLGGTSGGGVYGSDVVEWDTTTGLWEAKPPVNATDPVPVGRYGHAITYDQARKVVVLVGGHAYVTGLNEAVNDSWEWDGLRSVWTETTSTGVRPLPRENHILTYDTLRGTTFLFGGTAPSDNTLGADYSYVPQEIWEYLPNNAPRPNGAGCTPASAASCMSGSCVDGVCCAQTAAQCNGTCKACNVAGKEGTCQDVPVGQSDDTCPTDQACDANHACKTRLGQTCATFSDCASGNCVDGVCCESACTAACKACNLAGKRGTCANVPAGEEDPANNACVSVDDVPRQCDGNGTCMNGTKATGKPCTAGGQCTTGYCIDGVCCNSTCTQTCYQCNRADALGTCSPIALGLVDHSATIPCDAAMQYCSGSGTCAMNKKPNGETCTGSADCGSGYCIDGVCCNSSCAGTCQSCAVPGRVGMCGNVLPGAVDASCGSGQFCDANAVCQSGAKPNGATCSAGTDCGSGFCVDGLCCTSACADTCYACSVPGGEGTCSPIPTGGVDTMAAKTCLSPNYCNKDHACTMGKKPNGATCGSDVECGSNFCVDGTCCESSCTGKCRSCKNATGTCGLTPDGLDLRRDCVGTAPGGVCGGTCDGQGACRSKPQGTVCQQAGCSEVLGLITGGGSCDGAGNCSYTVSTPCGGFGCYTDATGPHCKTDCKKDPDCAIKRYCLDGSEADGGVQDAGADAGAGSQCPPAFDLGHACTRNTQCLSGTCSDGVCCNINCDKCGSCNMPGSEGTCIPIPAGTDPEMECMNSASDPTMMCKGFCNGRAACTYPAAGTTCGLCKACNGSGLCNTRADDDVACGTVDCDNLDTSCMDFHDLTTHRCADVGVCKTGNALATCTDVTSTCGNDGGAGGSGGGSAGGAGGGGAGGSKVDAGEDGGTAKSGGGGCGCDLGGPHPAGLAPMLLGLGLLLARRRRR